LAHPWGGRSHDASFPSELPTFFRVLGAALRSQRGGDDLLERLHLGNRKMQMPGGWMMAMAWTRPQAVT
jgi:hypothetical protein